MAEQTNRTIVEMARSMIHAQHLGYEFWMEALWNVVYMRSRCPTNVENKTPGKNIEREKAAHLPHARV